MVQRLASVQDFQAQVLELGNHLRVVQLQLYHACVKTFLFGQVFGKLGRSLPIDDEFEVISSGHEMDLVPIPLFDFLLFQSILDRRNGRFVILVNDQAIPSKATMLLATRGMKIPSPHDLLAQANCTQIRMVALKIPLPGRVLDGTYAYATVRFGPSQAIAELQFEVADFLVLFVSKVTTTSLVTVSPDHAILDHPSILGISGDGLPTGKCLAVKD